MEYREMTKFWSYAYSRFILLCFYLLFSICGVHAEKTTEVTCMPRGIHISYGDSIQEVNVVWTTDSTCSTDVMFGSDPWNIKSHLVGFMSHVGLEKDGYCLHRVVIKNLQQGTTYYYIPMSSGIDAGVFYFKTPVNNENWKTEMVMYGSTDGTQLNKEIMSGRYAAALRIGNVGFHTLATQEKYTKAQENETCDYQNVYLPTTNEHRVTSLPHLLAPADVNDDVMANYRNENAMPGTPWPIPLNKMWYSLDVGMAHIVSLSTEVVFSNQGVYASAQKTWLMADLKQANDNRHRVPWVIAFGLRPFYCHSNDSLCDQQKSNQVREELEDVLFTYGVDVIISDHSDTYERFYPIYKNTLLGTNFSNPEGPILINSGLSGLNTNITSPQDLEGFMAFEYKEHLTDAFVRMSTLNSTHFHWELVSGDGVTIDQFYVTKDRHGPFKIPQELLPTTVKPPEVKVPETDSHKTGSESSHPNTIPDSHSVTDNGGVSKTNRVLTQTKDFIKSTKGQIIVAVVTTSVIVIIIAIILVTRHYRRRDRRYRRWDETIDYGRKFYSSGYSNINKADKDGDDFEVEVADGNATSKLLSE